jgi:hypothetical protein
MRINSSTKSQELISKRKEEKKEQTNKQTTLVLEQQTPPLQVDPAALTQILEMGVGEGHGQSLPPRTP